MPVWWQGIPGNSVLSAQFLYKPKTSLKMERRKVERERRTHNRNYTWPEESKTLFTIKYAEPFYRITIKEC